MAAPTLHPTSERRTFAMALGAITLLGLVLRAVHLDIPMRYDESVTYLSYAAQGWTHITVSYAEPNNHVLHSLLVHGSTLLFGDAPWALRLPAFLAGSLLAPATAWATLSLDQAAAAQGRARGAALVGAAVVATAPILVEFSVNARGYTLVALFTLLAVVAGRSVLTYDGGHPPGDGSSGSGWAAWSGLTVLGVAALFTVPVAVLPWAGLTIWLAEGLRRLPDPRSRRRGLGLLTLVNLAVGLILLGLYSGILRAEGVEALTGNRFVTPVSPVSFLLGAPAAAWKVLEHWARGVPVPVALLALLLAGAGVLLRPRSAANVDPLRLELDRLLLSLALGALLVMAVVRNWGEPRIWLWGLPFFAIAVGAGVGAVANRRAGIVAGTWAVMLAAWTLATGSVRASTETGVFPEMFAVLDQLSDSYRPDDWLVGDFVAVEPLRYYLVRRWATRDLPPEDGLERTWIILDTGAPERVENVRSMVSRMGAPPLSQSNPVFTVGDVWVYLYGRPLEGPPASPGGDDAGSPTSGESSPLPDPDGRASGA